VSLPAGRQVNHATPIKSGDNAEVLLTFSKVLYILGRASNFFFRRRVMADIFLVFLLAFIIPVVIALAIRSTYCSDLLWDNFVGKWFVFTAISTMMLFGGCLGLFNNSARIITFVSSGIVVELREGSDFELFRWVSAFGFLFLSSAIGFAIEHAKEMRKRFLGGLS